MSRTRKMVRCLVRLGLALSLVLVVYAVVGTLLSLVPVNRNALCGDAVAVYLIDNGVHTDIVVPTKTDRIDWSKVAPPEDTASKTQASYLAFGWGAQDFYLNVPDWTDLKKPKNLYFSLRAISGVGGTALHTFYLDEPKEWPDCRRLPLSAAQYDMLVKYILASGQRNDAGCFVPIPHAGYHENDAFYEGTGHYSPFFTCNTWVNSALKACGQKCCLWTAFSSPIFWKHPLDPTR